MNSNPQKESVVEEIHGIKVSDPYRWLENADSEETKEWIDIHNKKVDTQLKDNSFNIFSEELVKTFKVTNFSSPIPVHGKYFYIERQPDEDQGVLYVKEGLHGEAKRLINPNGKREGNTVTIDYWEESSTGKYVAYGLSEGGDEMATLYVKNVETNEDLEDKIIHCRYSCIRWLPDDSGFFYTRNPRPGTVPKNEEHLHTKVYFHKLGDDSDNDELIFGKDRPKDDMTNIRLSPDGKYLAIHVAQTWTENDVYIYDTKTKETKLLTVSMSAKFQVRFLKYKILIYTNYKSNNYRILWASYEDLFKPMDEWSEFISEREYLLQSFLITKSKILVQYLVNASSQFIEFDHNGKEVGKINLPEHSSLAGFSGRIEEEEFFYGVNSFVFPKILYRYDPETSKYSEYRKTENPINPDEFEVKQEWFESKDKTKVPMFIFHKKGIELGGTNPTILYGYGGFGNNETPSFMRNWIPWIQRGGVFAVANIRGGGEFGESWHKDGIKEKKQNSFDDFASAGEYLISKKYTSKEHFGILGGSNGGLLVSAVGIQRPDLFGAICSKVPLTDMVRFHKFGIGIRWVHEYGNPDIKEELENILKWSPYHNVKENIQYPSFLFTTANKDTRVDPLHARKMAAMLEGANSNNEVFVFTEMEAGHGPGKPIVKIVENQAIILSFFSKKLGLKIWI
jgi:prolyl oligopeptidase